MSLASRVSMPARSEGAVRRNAEFDGRAVRVGVEGNTVTLEQTAGRLRDACWSVDPPQFEVVAAQSYWCVFNTNQRP
jgi:hypothetical protein